MTCVQAIASCFRQYATGSGRASRSEYWYWMLFTLLGSLVTTIIDVSVFQTNIADHHAAQPVHTVFELITFLPSVAVGLRRLHDTNRSGWWILISLTIIGIIPMISWACQKGTEGPNQFDDVSPRKSKGAIKTFLMVILGVLAILVAISIGIGIVTGR